MTVSVLHHASMVEGCAKGKGKILNTLERVSTLARPEEGKVSMGLFCLPLLPQPGGLVMERSPKVLLVACWRTKRPCSPFWGPVSLGTYIYTIVRDPCGKVSRQLQAMLLDWPCRSSSTSAAIVDSRQKRSKTR